MAFPHSFSTTADCPFMENSPSTVTVRLSTSCTPMTASTSRFVSFSSEIDTPARPRAHTESDVLKKMPSPPPSQSRGKYLISKMTVSTSLSTSSGRPASKPKPTTPSMEPRSEMESSMSWFGRAVEFINPWEDEDEGVSMPEEQKQAFAQTHDVSLTRIYDVCC